MVKFGYTLSTEEHSPTDLVYHAKQAERAGFAFAIISDHYHPWIDAQGQSPFVWSVIGGIATTTERIELGTAVTCPTIRIHPAIIAQAAATSAAMMPGRFFLGVGSGENLNEHILGDRWPEIDIRLDMLVEAVDVIRTLWSGEMESYHGSYYTVENARLYTLPEEPPPIVVAASGPKSGEVAAGIGDGLMTTSPSPQLLETFHNGGNGNASRPSYVQLKVCYDEDEQEARRFAHQLWPTTAMPGQLNQELAIPQLFEQAAQLVTEDQVAEKTVCGPDPDRHAEQIKQAIDAGFDHVAITQIGPKQEEFVRFYQERVLPRFQ